MLAGSPSPSSKAVGGEPTVIGGYALAIARALGDYGIDSAPVFESVGLGALAGNNPLVRVPYETISRLLGECSRLTGDPCFGLALSRHIHISHLHAFGHALTASATLLDYCRRVERYFKLASQADAPTLVVTSREVTLRRKPVVDLVPEVEDAFAGFLVLAMRHLHRDDFAPVAVGFMHEHPATGSERYDALFRCPLAFGQPELSVRFLRSTLEQPLSGACAELAQINDSIAIRYLALIERGDVIARVRQSISELLPTGNCTRDTVADHLNLSPAMLQYKLSKRNTTFQAILDETRRDLACSFVLQPSRSITDIALAVGFTDSSNFTRAFRRWTGLSPSTYRNRQQASGPHAAILAPAGQPAPY